MTTQAGPAPPLAGVRIADFGQYVAGPMASRLLADLGADVVKVEPLTGDLMRPAVRCFEAAQRGKRSIAIDLKHPEGAAIAVRLATRADIVAHGMRPGVAERLGIGYDDIRSVNPDVVYVYSPGWGSRGPLARKGAFAPLVTAVTGVHYEMAGAGNPPVLPYIPNEDVAGALSTASAMLLGLAALRLHGQGQYIEVPQLNSTLLLSMTTVRLPDGRVAAPRPLDPDQRGRGALHRLYRTNDGWICLALDAEDEFPRLGSMLRLLDSSATLPPSDECPSRAQEVVDAVSRVFSAMSTSDCVAALQRSSIPYSVPAGSYEEAIFDDDESVRLGRIAVRHDDRFGATRAIAHLVGVSPNVRDDGAAAPKLGEHTTEILQALGYKPSEIADLHTRAIVA